jgi:hypothetical protein
VYSSEICSLRFCIPKSSKIKIVSHAPNPIFFVFYSCLSATLVTLSLYRLVPAPCRFLASSKFRYVWWQCGICPALFKCLQYQQMLIDDLDIAVFAINVVFMIQTEEFPQSFLYCFPFFFLSTEYINQLKFYCNKYCHYFQIASYEKKLNK